MSKETKYFLEVEELLTRDFYNFYKQERQHMALGIDQYNYFVKAVNGLLNTITRLAVETKGGIHIKGLGYFCHVRSKKKRRNITDKNPLTKFKRKYYYDFTFIPDEKLKEWYLEPSMNTFKQLPEYRIDLEAIELYYEIDKYNRRLHEESKEIKYFI